MASSDVKPKSISRAKKWSEEIENLYRFQQAGYRDEIEYKQVKQVSMVRFMSLQIWTQNEFVRGWKALKNKNKQKTHHQQSTREYWKGILPQPPDFIDKETKVQKNDFQVDCSKRCQHRNIKNFLAFTEQLCCASQILYGRP